MSRRIFVNVKRGMTDNTATCVFPWELAILAHVHGGEVNEVSIDQLTDLQKPVKVEKLKLKHTEHPAPDLRSQLEIMAYVDPEEDPANDAAGEYERLAMKFGMDKDFPMPVVERIYGQFSSGAFEEKLKVFAKDRCEMPQALRAMNEGLDKAPNQMTVGELRAALRDRGIKFKVTEGRDALAEKLGVALVE